MHVYIYDSYVNERKYAGLIAKIETRITDLGLNGKIVRLGTMNSVYDIVVREIKKGAKTIVAVGNNNLLNQTINSMAKFCSMNNIGLSVPLGFIPVGQENNNVASLLGISADLKACDILSARRVEQLDLGCANQVYFLTQSTIPAKGTLVEIDDKYTIELLEAGEIKVINMPIEDTMPPGIISSPFDDSLELFVSSGRRLNKLFGKKEPSNSVFSFKKINIFNDKYPLLLDNSIKIKTPAEVTLAGEKIRLIVGKNRHI